MKGKGRWEIKNVGGMKFKKWEIPKIKTLYTIDVIQPAPRFKLGTNNKTFRNETK